MADLGSRIGDYGLRLREMVIATDLDLRNQKSAILNKIRNLEIHNLEIGSLRETDAAGFQASL
jgi:hypothetical protein